MGHCAITHHRRKSGDEFPRHRAASTSCRKCSNVSKDLAHGFASFVSVTTRMDPRHDFCNVE
jgi:hypothetical protein